MCFSPLCEETIKQTLARYTTRRGGGKKPSQIESTERRTDPRGGESQKGGGHFSRCDERKRALRKRLDCTERKEERTIFSGSAAVRQARKELVPDRKATSFGLERASFRTERVLS